MNEKQESTEITLERMRHMPLKELASLDLSVLEDLRSKSVVALEEARRLGSQDLIFNVQVAKSWIDCAIRVKKRG